MEERCGVKVNGDKTTTAGPLFRELRKDNSRLKYKPFLDLMVAFLIEVSESDHS